MTKDENTVFIGQKPPMNYVLAVVTQFNSGATEVWLKSRGRAISRAVDVAEIVRSRFVEDADVKDIRIGTERVTDERGRASNVSSIAILLAKVAATPVEVKLKDKTPPTTSKPSRDPVVEVTA